ncbi:MAG: histidine kinase, partial [bacterium]
AYMMEGFQDDWIDLGNQGLAMFTNLDPGDYTFRVKAANSRGVWNQEGASIKVSIAPPFWRTGWFLVLSATVVLSLLIGGYRFRTAQIRREKEAQEFFSRKLIEKQEEERKRIAGELHDSVGQGLLIIKNGLKFVQNAISKNDEKAIEELEEISEVAQQAIDEIREISYGLHPHQLEQMGLKKAIESTIKTIATTNALNIESNIASVDGILAKDKEILLFRIVQESLNNIIKHAQASKSSVRLAKNETSLHIHIDDNGKGFAQKPATLLASNHKGLGLIGIAERVKILGGKLEIHSTPGAGTSLKIEIPLKLE